MSKKIKNLDLSRLRTEEDFGFMQKVVNLTGLLTLETDKQMVADFTAAVEAFDNALKASQKNSKTAEVEAEDARVDKAWRTLTQLTKVLTAHPTEEVSEAATTAYAIMTKYGDITGMAYNEEYGNLHNALQELTAIAEAKQKLILIDALVSELETGYENFMIASAEKDAEEAQRQVGIVKETRAACDAAYRTLADKVNALVIVNGEDSYADFIDQVNVIVADAKATLTSRSTRNAKKDSATKKNTSTAAE